MPFSTEVGLGPGPIVLDGNPSPTFWPIHCSQMAGWIKMPLGTEVGLGPGYTVLDGDPAPPKKGTFWPMSTVAKQLDESRCHLIQK